jgi:hypothetical protein
MRGSRRWNKTYAGRRTIDGLVVTVDGKRLDEHYDVQRPSACRWRAQPPRGRPWRRRGPNWHAGAHTAAGRPPSGSACTRAVLLHRGRERRVRRRMELVNALRAHLAECGVIAPQGLRNVSKLIAVIRDQSDTRLPVVARQVTSEPATWRSMFFRCTGSMQRRDSSAR